MSNFAVVKDLRIGHIVEVSGTSIRVELDGDVTDLSRTHAGRVYHHAAAQCGDELAQVQIGAGAGQGAEH
jgi:hypothetical protein